MKITVTCSPLTGHPLDTKIAASTDKEWQHRSIEVQVPETTGKYYQPP